MPEFTDILTSLRRKMSFLHERFGVARIGVFGSFARGEQTGTSDLDLLVDFDATPDLLEFVALKYYLEDLLQKSVDLITREGIKPGLAPRICEEVAYV